MNLSFLPGELYLNKTKDGSYIITLQGKEILQTRSEKKAISEYNKLRRELESQFPSHELSSEEKRELLRKYVAESKVGLDHNSFRPQEKKKKSGSTRTFG